MTTIDPGRTAYEARFAHETNWPADGWETLPEDARAIWRRVEEACQATFDDVALALCRSGFDGCEDGDDGFRACRQDLCRCRRAAQTLLDGSWPIDRSARDQRQAEIYAWIERAFGHVEGVNFTSLDERGRRFLEEAVELFQAIRPDDPRARAHAHRVIDYVFDRKAGLPFQEIGGVMVTLNGLAQVLGHSVAEAEDREFSRVLAKPIEHFQKRQAAKRGAGI